MNWRACVAVRMAKREVRRLEAESVIGGAVRG